MMDTIQCAPPQKVSKPIRNQVITELHWIQEFLMKESKMTSTQAKDFIREILALELWAFGKLMRSTPGMELNTAVSLPHFWQNLTTQNMQVSAWRTSKPRRIRKNDQEKPYFNNALFHTIIRTGQSLPHWNQIFHAHKLWAEIWCNHKICERVRAGWIPGWKKWKVESNQKTWAVSSLQ